MPRNDYDDRTFMEKYGLAVAAVVLLLLLALLGTALYVFQGKMPPPHKPDEIAVHLLPPPPLPPPPPPPPPPKTPPPPKEQKMVEMKPQDKTPPKPMANNTPPGPPGPKASGPPSDEGIGGTGGPGGDGIGDSGGSVFGYYASQVGDQVRAALARDPRTRNAVFHVKGHVVFDTTGHITRSSLATSSDDPAIDAAIKDVLSSLQLTAPPQGMPPSITMNLEGKRPN